MTWKGKGSGMKRLKKMRGLIILVVMVALAVGYYFYLSNRTRSNDDDDITVTRVQELLMRNLEQNYPATPKEVVKLYSDITQCFYGEKYSEEELERLATMAYALFDEELAAANPWNIYYAKLIGEIEEYKKNHYVISAYTTSSSVDIEHQKFTKDGYTCTRVYVYYTMRRETVIDTLNEVFVLRKDKSGYWRIYGWQLVEE